MSRPRRAIVMGIDGGMFTLINRFIANGKMPNTARLVKKGSIFEAYPIPPCNTPTNWACIATGSSTGRHGSTGFYFHRRGDRLDVGAHPENMGRTFDSRNITAEHFWTAAERQGKQNFIINYPGNWPPVISNGIVMRNNSAPPHRISESRLYVKSGRAKEKEDRSLIELKRAPEFKKATGSFSVPMKAEMLIESEGILGNVGVEVLILDSEGKGYDSAIVIDETGAVTRHTKRLRLGDWSECITREFQVTGNTTARKGQVVWGKITAAITEKKMKGYFWLQLRRLSHDTKDLELFMTPVFTTFDWVHPRELGAELLKNVPFYIGLGYETAEKELERLGLKPYREKEYSFLNSYRVRTAIFLKIMEYITKKKGWDICFFHYHLMDHVNHMYTKYHYPHYGNESKEIAMGGQQRGYEIVDELVGELLNCCVDEDTLVIVVGDHAAVPVWKYVRIGGPLIRAGLLSYNWDDGQNRYIIDWSKTKAYPYIEPPYIWINLKGRDPNGIVNPEDYESVQEEIAKALLSVRDPETGQCPFALVLKKEDAWVLGQFGPRVGDVVWFLKPPYTPWEGDRDDFNQWELSPESMKSAEVRKRNRSVAADHDWYLPWARLDIFTNATFLVMAGPGIKKGFRAEQPVLLNSISPTMSLLLGIKPPAQADGQIIQEAIDRSGVEDSIS